VKRLWDDDELTIEWTLQPSDQPLLANKTGATQYEVPAAVVTHLPSQVGVPAETYVASDWRGRTIKYHRVQIRTGLGILRPAPDGLKGARSGRKVRRLGDTGRRQFQQG
jgi:hypothetical protein